MTKKRAFSKKRNRFNTSYYKRQVIDENTKHFQVKKWISEILKEFSFNVFVEYTHPLLVPKYSFECPLRNLDKPKPYTLDILAYNEQIGQIITLEVNGPYHYRAKQIQKDENRKYVIIEWVKKCFSHLIEWKCSKWIHKHVALSRDDIYKGFLDYEGVISLIGL